MNELDLKTKIEGLEKAIKEHQDFANTYEGQLKATKKALEDYNKPALTPVQLDAIFEAVDKAIENFSFSDCDNYETEFSLDYDGRVQLESIDLQDRYELVSTIAEKVQDLFKEVDCPEDGHFTESVKEQTS
jgi:DNA-binding FrmR family transcriptional regulator